MGRLEVKKNTESQEDDSSFFSILKENASRTREESYVISIPV